MTSLKLVVSVACVKLQGRGPYFSTGSVLTQVKTYLPRPVRLDKPPQNVFGRLVNVWPGRVLREILL